MSAFKREPPPQEETQKRVDVCLKSVHMSANVSEMGEKAKRLKSG